QRRDLARAIRGAAPRQRAGPLPGLLSPARAGVALRRPPSAGAQAQARRALHALDREQWTRWLLYRDGAHHRAGQGIERTDRRLRIDEGGAGPHLAPAQAGRVLRRDRGEPRRVHAWPRYAAGAAALLARPGLRPRGTAVGALR